MTTHTITLARHTAQVVGLMGVLVLGTCDSYGTEQLLLRPSPEWDGLAIDATFHNVPNDEGVTVLADTDGLVTVPPEACMRASKYATITFRGVQDGVQRISCNLPYMVLDHAQVPGANSTATPSENAQALAQMQDLRDGAVDAKNQAEAARDDAAKSAVDAKESETNAGQSATAAANSATDAAASEKNAAASAKRSEDASKVVPTAEISANTAARHSHTNKGVLDGITAAKTAEWDAKAGTAVATTSADGLMSKADKAKLDGITAGGGGGSVPKPLTYDYMPEGYPSRTMQTATLMEEQELAFSDSDGIYFATLPSTFEIVEGQTYTVKWDGTEYECVGVALEENLIVIGNLSIGGAGDDTGEPFICVPIEHLFGTLDTSASHTISVKTTGETVTPMAEEFLPKNLATKSDVETAQTAANNAQTTADAAFANFPIKYSDVVDTPFSAIEFSGEVTGYSRSSINGGTFIDLYLASSVGLKGSGFYKVSSDVFDFEDIYKIRYKYKYDSGDSSSLISVDDLEPEVTFSSDHSVFVISKNILFCGSTGTFTITVNKTTYSFYVAETGIYSVTNYQSILYSFINYIEVTRRESGFIQSGKPVLIPSSTEGSKKKFKITVDDSGTISATEVT